jgi:uncharacterized membrane protein YhaH (DUF805 family)
MAYQVGLTLGVAAGLMAIAGTHLAESLADGLAGNPAALDLRGLSAPIAFAIAAQTALSVLTLTSMRARLHDIGMSVWWSIPISLPSLAAFAGATLYAGVNADVLQAIGIDVTLLFVTLLAMLPGTSGDNSYGPPPRRAAPEASESAASGPHAGCRPAVPPASNT